MKIGITTFGADAGRSGIGRYVIQLLQAFAALPGEHRYEIIAHQSERHLFAQNASNFELLTISDRLRPPLLNIAWHQTVLPRLCRQRGYDVLFLPAANRRIPFRLPCPAVGTVHDFSSLHITDKYDKFRLFYIRQVLPFLMRRLDRVLTISESSADDIVTYGQVTKQNVFITPLAADSRRFSSAPDTETDKATALEIRQNYGLHRPYILYVSRLEHPGKNHVRLISAFEHLKNTANLPHQLVLAGADSQQAEIVHAAAQQSLCARDVRFLDFVDDNDLPALYRAADLFVFPSLYEGFGLPILEAMACGTPVVCADISSLPEVAGDAALLFDPYDIQALSKAMSTMLNSADTRNDYVSRGLQRCKAFDWKTTAARTLDVLCAAADAKPVR